MKTRTEQKFDILKAHEKQIYTTCPNKRIVLRAKMVSILLSVLPHGGGIGTEWRIVISDMAIKCHNQYLIDDRWVYFTIKIRTIRRTIDGNLSFSLMGQFGKTEQNTRKHLRGAIGYALNQL